MTHFHAKNLERRRDEFRGWNDERHDELVDALMPVIGTYCTAPLMAGINADAYRYLKANPEARDAIGSPTRMAFRAVLINLRDFVLKYKVKGQVHFLIDQGMPDVGALTALRKRIEKGVNSAKEFSFMGPITLASVKDNEELQAADYVAYEHYRHITNALGEGRAPRLATHRLKTRKLIGRFHVANNFTKHWDIESVKSYEKWRAEGGML